MSAALYAASSSSSSTPRSSPYNGAEGGGGHLPLHLPDIPDHEPNHLIAEPFAALNLVRFNILVVDDAPLIVRMTTMLLTRKGHTVHQAVNGAEALDRILEGYMDEKCDAAPGTPPFDVVVMDLQMPIMDGIEAIRRLRAAEYRFKCGLTSSTKALKPRMEEEEKYTDLEMGSYNYGGGEVSNRVTTTSGIAMSWTTGGNQSSRAAIDMQYHQYVIAVSANSDNETIQEAIKAGADSFVAKPFSYDSFSEAMQRRPM